MCGIVGYVGARDCSDVLVSALTKLEYRGYDSAGIAVFATLLFAFTFFFVSSFRALVEMNWPIIAYHSFYALAAIGTRSLRLIKATVSVWVAAALFAPQSPFGERAGGEQDDGIDPRSNAACSRSSTHAVAPQ